MTDETTSATPCDCEPRPTALLAVQDKPLFEDLTKHLASANTSIQSVPFPDPKSRTFFIRKGSGDPQLVTLDVPFRGFTRRHSFGSVDGFADYLNTEQHCGKDLGVIFVEENCVRAVLNYNRKSIEDHQEFAILPLERTEAAKALWDLFQSGVTQKILWRRLATHLASAVVSSDPDELMIVISNLQVLDNSEGRVQIDASGLCDSRRRASLKVAVGDSQTNIPVDWTFKVPFWTATPDISIQVQTRLELINDNGSIRFFFHPRNLERIVLDARLELTEMIKALAPIQFSVHEGKFLDQTQWPPRG